MSTYDKTNRTTLKRLPKRGFYDRDLVHGILDEGFICHVGFVVDGQPIVIPTATGASVTSSTFTVPRRAVCYAH